MDWISLIFWIIIALRIILGLFRGGMKTLFAIIVMAAGIGLAFLLCKYVGNWIGDMGARDGIYNGINGTLSSIKADIQTPYGTVQFGLGSEISRADLDTLYAQWVAAGNTGTVEDMLSEVLRAGYKACFMPSGIWQNLDTMIFAAIPATGTFTFASLIATAIASAACVGIGFVATFLAVCLVGFIIMTIVNFARKIRGKKPSLLSRIIGALIGAATGLLICWAISILLQSLGTYITPMNNWLTETMRLEDSSYWNIGKFFFTLKFGFSDLFNWFLSLIKFA